MLDLLRTHITDEGATLHASAEVRDLDPSYRKFDRQGPSSPGAP
ncbi:hypothetical protein [Streptomyces sp. NPDC001508]